MERKNIFTVKGNPVTVEGEEIKVGQEAPGFRVFDSDLNEVTLDKFKGKVKLIAAVPSLDTPVCDTEIKRFNDEAAKLSKDLVIIFISADLPFAQKRFCQAYDIKKVKTYSDHRDVNFGSAYGILIKELRLLGRAIFIIDRNNRVCYVEYVKELGSPPDYDGALKALKNVLNQEVTKS